jgi:phosphoglycolate phosphatase-like HAD superfamily hydrolase
MEFNAACAVWDFDGTIIDSFKIFEESLPEVLQRWGKQMPSRDLLLNNYHGRFKDAIHTLFGFEGDELDRFCMDFVETEEHLYQNPEGLYYEDAVDLLQRNHEAGIRQIIVTNRFHHRDTRLGSPRNLAKRSPLAGLIDAVVCGDDNSDFHKPDARMLDKVERDLGINRSELIVIGDQFVDADLAHNLSAHAIIVTRNGDSVPHLDKLRDGWENQVTLIKDLGQISIKPL